MKLIQKMDHFTVFKSFPGISCCLYNFSPNKTENLAGWMNEIVSGMLTLGEWQGMEMVGKGQHTK